MTVFTEHQAITYAAAFSDEDLFQVSNYAGPGAAFLASGAAAEVTVNGATFSGNSATSLGGAIQTTSGANITIGSGTLFENNYGGSAGGAIYMGQPLNYLTIDGATFANNLTNGDGAGYNGGAIYNDCRDRSVVTLTVRNSTFTNNDATPRAGRGGAIDSWGNNYTENSVFDHNIAAGGGAINLYTGSIYEDKGSVFSGNTATVQGGVMWNRSVATFTGSTFTGNYTAQYGGAVYTGNGGTNPTTNLIDCVVTGNTAGIGGGAILSYLGTQNITGCTVTDNTALSQYGGGVFNQNSLAIVTGGLFKNNSAYVGGGLFNWTASTMSITGSTITGNTGTRAMGAGPAAGGVFNSSVLTMTDAIVEGNYSEAGAGVGNEGGALTVSGGLFTGNTAIRGAGIWSNRRFVLDGSTFTNNIASIGAGIFVSTGAGGDLPLTISNAVFSGNTAGDGSANWAGAGAYLGADIAGITISDTLFLDNLGTAGRGAAFALDARSTVSVAGGTFARNTNTSNWGGAIYNGGVMTVSNVLFDENRVEGEKELGYGGAIFNDGIMTIDGSTFTNNFANANQGGAAIYHNNGRTLTVTNSLFDGNNSDTKGGAISSSNTGYTVTGCTFTNNTAEKEGGALNNTNGGLTINNSYFSGNTAEYGGAVRAGGSISIESSTFATESDSIYVEGGVALTGTNVLNGSVRGKGALTISGGTSTLAGSIKDFATLEIASGSELDLTQNGYISDTAITNEGQLNADFTAKWTYKTKVILNGVDTFAGVNLTFNDEVAGDGVIVNDGNQKISILDGSISVEALASYVEPNRLLDTLVDETKTNYVKFDQNVASGTLTARKLDRDLKIEGNGEAATAVTAGALYAGGNSLALSSLKWTGSVYGGVKDGTVEATELELSDVALSKDVYGGVAAATEDAGVEGDVVVKLTNVTGERSYFGAGYANGGDITVDGAVRTTIDGGAYKAIYNGANMSANATGNSYSIGEARLTIEDGEFSGIVGNGGFVRAGQTSTQGYSLLTINGGTFNNYVYGGAFAYGTGSKSTTINAGTATVEGNIQVNINGGTFNADVYGGSLASNSHIATANTSVTGSVTITLDATENAIALNGNLYAGSLGKGLIGGDTIIYVKGTDANLTFGSDSWITGTSEYGNTVHGYVSGEKILAFNDYTGDFTAKIGNGAFDRVAVALDSIVTITNAEFDMVSTWNLYADSFIGGNLSADALDLSGDAINVKLVSGEEFGTDDVTLMNSATGLVWNSATAVNLFGEAAAATETDGVWESDHYRLTATAAGTLTVGIVTTPA